MFDERLYTVTWSTGRRGNLTAAEAVEWVQRIRQDWRRFACRGVPGIKVWYRDGSLVAYADLERRVLGESK